jgi:hypothetical protein
VRRLEALCMPSHFTQRVDHFPIRVTRGFCLFSYPGSEGPARPGEKSGQAARSSVYPGVLNGRGWMD